MSNRSTAYLCAFFFACTTILYFFGKAFQRRLMPSFSAYYDQEASVENPIYPAFAKIADKFNFDASFSRHLRRGETGDPLKNKNFHAKPNSFDAIIFGDSSLIFSASQEIISEVSGLNVAIIGNKCLVPDEKLFDLADKIADVLLKKDGLLLFGIADHKQWANDVEKNCQPAKGAMTPLNELSHRTDGAISEFLAHIGDASENEFSKSTSSTQGVLNYFSPQHYAAYQADLFSFFDRAVSLVGNSSKGLPNLELYKNIVEPIVAPNLHAKKIENYSSGKDLSSMLWDKDGTTMFYIKDNAPKSPVTHASSENGVKEILEEPTIAKNRIKSFSQMRHKNALTVGFYVRPEMTEELRGFYNSELFSNLLKLDQSMYLPEGTLVEYQGWSHLANRWGVVQSVIIGRWLKSLSSGPISESDIFIKENVVNEIRR